MKTEMVDMQRPKPKKTGMEDIPATFGISHERYPYGLQIRLGTEELSKLGIDVTGMNAGQSLIVKGKCEVCEVRNVEMMDDKGKPKKDQCLELQIQKLAVSSTDSFKGGFDDEED